MSFSYNPFKHLDIVDDGNTYTLVVYCSGCGSERNRIQRTDTVERAFEIMALHLRDSHDYTPEQLKGWSVY